MSSLSSENIKSASPISIWSLLVKDSSGNFRPAVQADITALGFTPWGGGSLNISYDTIYTTLNSSQAPNWTNTSATLNPTTDKFVIFNFSTGTYDNWFSTTRLPYWLDWVSGWTDLYVQNIVWPMSNTQPPIEKEFGVFLKSGFFYRTQSQQQFIWWASVTVLQSTSL